MGLVMCAALGVFWFCPNAAHAGSGFRTVLVIDASSSMRRTDPTDLRKVAAELFVDLARRGDEIAVTGFDENARQSTGAFITITGPESRERIKAAIRAIGNDGKWTDFTSGLGEAKRLLDAAAAQKGGQELILFLTDGRCEPDPQGALAQGIKSRPDREKACQEQVLGPLARELGRARVYAIGLSKNAPADFLEELGRRTGGQGVVTLDPAELPRLFAGVYARLLGSRLQEGDVNGSASFQVYKSAETLDLVVVGRSDKTGTLKDPTGEVIAIDNRDPDKVYFVAAREYRFYKIRAPRPGTWTLEVTGAGKRRFATLQHFDLGLAFLDPPEAVEKDRAITLRARLSSPSGAMPPMDFLDRHAMTALIRDKGPDGQDRTARVEMKRRDDGSYVAEYTATSLGLVGLGLELAPKSEGVLSRKAENLATMTVIPPVHLKAAAMDAGAIKQGQAGQVTLSMAGSEVGVPLGLTLGLISRQDAGMQQAGADAPAKHPLLAAMTMSPDTVALVPGGADSFDLRLALGENAPAGRHTVFVTITPASPASFADRAITVPLTIDVIALSFWERYGRMVQYSAGGLVFLLLVLGFVTPARFKKRAILYYADVRDMDMVRRSSYPLGTRAKRGFYRPARIALGPTGPVKKGGVVRLQAGSGGSVDAMVLSSSATVRKTPLPATDEDDPDRALADALGDEDRSRVPLKNGQFRMSAGLGYEIEGSGLVFWYK